MGFTRWSCKLERKEKIKMKNLVIFNLFLLGTIGCSPVGENPAKPNIIFIFTDQQSAKMLSCAGNPHVQTPHLDKLAQSGIRFEQTFVTNPVCSPSRFSLMTGLMPSQVNGEDNMLMMGQDIPQELLDNSLGVLFRNAGYETVYGGKVHLPGHGGNDFSNDVSQYGFSVLTDDDRDELAEISARFIRQKHDKPFLLVASFINPHDICFMVINEMRKARNENPIGGIAWKKLQQALRIPDGVSEDEFFNNICPPLPDNFEPPSNEFPAAAGSIKPHAQYGRDQWGEKEWRLHRWAYKNLTELVDRKIGTILQALYESEYDDNTIVVFTSDHGDMDGSHRLEHKSVFYDESVRVPLIFRWKGKTEPGKVDKSTLVINGLDLLPTLCDFAGIAIPENMPGVSLKNVVTGNQKELVRDYVVSETLGARMVFDGEWKYMAAGNPEQHEMLFNLKNDPGEMHNLALETQHSEQLQRCRKMLTDWYAKKDIRLDKAFMREELAR
jgi:arylsulfatase A-like enzyme